MVKDQNKNIAKSDENQGKAGVASGASKIGPSTKFETISERLSPFGGLLGLVKFMDLVKFKEIFDGLYIAPSRKPVLGHYNMVYGLLILLFIGFNRVWHFLFIQFDSMICSIFDVVKLPYVTTYWRYVNSLGINQGKAFLLIMSALRERVWHLCDIEYETIHIDIDPTTTTVYGNQQGSRKCYNPRHRGKKGFRQVLCFIAETREYIFGKFRSGKTLSGEESSQLILELKKHIPRCVKNVILRADSEITCWESVKAAEKEEYQFIFSNDKCKPVFEDSSWYKIRKNDEVEYNECMYQPTGWKKPHRFLIMRIPIEEPKTDGPIQLELLDVPKYKCRIFVTNLTKKPHKCISEYDKRADCENSIGEAQREGISAIPSRKFANNYACFQMVMLSYNIWRSFKMLAGQGLMEEKSEAQADSQSKGKSFSKAIVDNTIRIARLKLLIIAAKVANSKNTTKVKYSEHDRRTENLFKFYEYLDKLRNKARPWLDSQRWCSKHLQSLNVEQFAFSWIYSCKKFLAPFSAMSLKQISLHFEKDIFLKMT